jgi:hypothetical protein
LSRSADGSINKAMCKVLCDNVCCLIQSTHELVIEAKFWRQEPEATKPFMHDVATHETDGEEWDWI